MKYSPRLYAAAFADIASRKLGAAEQAKIVKNFLAVILKNNDTHELKKILAETDRLLREKTGTRKVVLETARDLKPSPQAILKHFLKKSDVVETNINPDLIAGLRLTINDQEQFDGSLKRKIDKLFS